MDKSELIGKEIVFIDNDDDGKEIHKIGTIICFEDYMTEEGLVVVIRCLDEIYTVSLKSIMETNDLE